MPSNLNQGLYAIEKSYQENFNAGPIYPEALPHRHWPDESEWIDFLGFRIASPLGVPAGPLLNADWIALAARLGFDLLTYKTIRSQAHPGHPLPNVLFVEPDPERSSALVRISPPSLDQLSITNSFGMPSQSPEFLRSDILKARHALQKGQLLVVSVVGSPNRSISLKEDFVQTALLAKESGAHIVEANFSCPNVTSREGQLCYDYHASYEIAKTIATAIAPTPLMVKVGVYKDDNLLRAVLLNLSQANVRAVCGINSLSMEVLNALHQPALGIDRTSSGICGRLIHQSAINFVRKAQQIITAERLDLELVGCGGIIFPEDFNTLLESGAKVALSATGMMWNPLLAHQWHMRYK